MTPGARVQAAVEVLGRVLGGAAAERELTAWARGARYAGSGDRAAVRDHVFDALRRLRSAAWEGGLGAGDPAAFDARATMAGLIRGQGGDVAALFTGAGHAPAPIDLPPAPGDAPEGVALDMPDWLLPRLRASLGDETGPICALLRARAPVFLRANLARTDADGLIDVLAEAGIAAARSPISPTALRLEGAPRGLAALPAFADGLFELQDAGSQSLVDRLPDLDGARVLDLCAGGGGKALAMAARGARVVAHDADEGRMRDLPVRAARAGAAIRIAADPEAEGPFDAVVADVPCSGSGAWRRAPEAKWRLEEARLGALAAQQDAILARAVRLVRPGGWVAYMTCSLLDVENAERTDAAQARDPSLRLETRWSSVPAMADSGCDGFHLSVLRRIA